MISIRKRLGLLTAAVAVAVGSFGALAVQASAQQAWVSAKVVVNGQTVIDESQCLPPA